MGRRALSAIGAIIGWSDTSSPAEEERLAECKLSSFYIWNSCLGLLVAAMAANASRSGRSWADTLFTVSIVWLYIPLAFKAFSATSSPSERLSAVVVATAGLYAVKLIREPLAFIEYDEFLHWTTANHILDSGRLFTPNALLPVSPLYPGLEATTTALVCLSGLSVFQAANLVLAACRLGLITALFLVYRRLSGSARIAACGCFVYMGSSTFLVFDTQFAYESPAVFLLVACILAEIVSREGFRVRVLLFAVLPLVGEMSITHHVTAYLLAAYLICVAFLSSIKAAPRFAMSSVIIALLGLALPLLWSKAMGNPEAGYLSPMLLKGADEFLQVLTFSTKRALFQAPDGYVTPAWQRVVTMAAVMLVCCGLATGFLRTLRLSGVLIGSAALTRVKLIRRVKLLRQWRSDALVVLTLLTVAYPISILFRLTQSGWEIGNRIGPFSFIGVGVVVAVGALYLGSQRDFLASTAFAIAAAIILIGGIISSEGPRILMPGTFQVAADPASISWMGIDAAEWTRRELGERNLFASDRINRLLLSTYGRQDVTSSLQDRVNLSAVILGPSLDPYQISLIGKSGIDYLSVDLRMSTALPGVGAYIDGDEGDQHHRAPPKASSLLKFDLLPSVGRVFDDGYILIYDMRSLRVPR